MKGDEMARRIVCFGGPCDGQTKAILYGVSMFDASTRALYRPMGKTLADGREVWRFAGILPSPPERMKGIDATRASVWDTIAEDAARECERQAFDHLKPNMVYLGLDLASDDAPEQAEKDEGR